MCGRFKLDKTVEEIIEHFNLVLDKDAEQFAPNSNISPGQDALIVTSAEPGKLQKFKWGLVPSWSKDAKTGYKMFNARAETLTEKPSYRNLIQNNRCLVITRGFYEWKEDGGGKKRPFLFAKDEKYTALAGLWDYNPALKLRTFTIITCDANSAIADYHDRMPVILNDEEQKKWLGAISSEEALALLKPCKDKIIIDDIGQIQNVK
jgi:putative SOS response-associated peptidase YedK